MTGPESNWIHLRIRSWSSSVDSFYTSPEFILNRTKQVRCESALGHCRGFCSATLSCVTPLPSSWVLQDYSARKVQFQTSETWKWGILKKQEQHFACPLTFRPVSRSETVSRFQKHPLRGPGSRILSLGSSELFLWPLLSCVCWCCLCFLHCAVCILCHVQWPVLTLCCIQWQCVDSVLCCVPVVFDSGRCNLPHGHQFGTAPSRGRQRAELIPTEVLFSFLCLLSLPPLVCRVLYLTSK